MDLVELWAIFGPGVSGAIFGAGWWFWIDAVVCSSVKVSFLHYLPGIFASLAALMFNCVRKEDIDYSPYEEGEWRTYTMPLEARLGNLVINDKTDKSLKKDGRGNQVEALAVLCICCVLCFSRGFSGSSDTRFTSENWPFSMDRNSWCLAVCVCPCQWADVLDCSLGVTGEFKLLSTGSF
ncbi:hypothetical protein F8388_003299 [Cannabis sativa]|uniref:Transmembrane protein 50A n=1 Tax=Cannabis sativa TaxID=3483 RepID=A0A7J6E3E0_CANSA|nr:hypothetical protein F8388_003299 [Cannabis sativa]KAF4366415.1 hypothetical protein G4B88_003127 [Cannabis sativa]